MNELNGYLSTTLESDNSEIRVETTNTATNVGNILSNVLEMRIETNEIESVDESYENGQIMIDLFNSGKCFLLYRKQEKKI